MRKEKIKILLIEDGKSVAEKITIMLQSYDYEVSDWITKGEEALQSIAKVPPDLVLIDIVLEGEMDGIQTAEQIQKNIEIPIIFITATSDEEYLQRSLKTDTYSILYKPFGDYELHSMIITTLSKFHKDMRLIENRERYRLLFENMTDAFVYIERTKEEGRIDYIIREVNLAFLIMVDKPKKDLLGQEVAASFPFVTEHIPDWREKIQLVSESSISENFKIIIRTMDIYLMVTAYSPQENFIALLIDDISETVKAEELLKKSEERYRKLYDNSHDALLLLQDKKFIDCNMAAVEMYGAKKKDQIIGNSPLEFSPQNQYDGTPSSGKADNYIKEAAANGTITFEWLHTRINGDLFDALITLSPIDDQESINILATVKDISGLKKAQKNLEENIRFMETLIETIPAPFFYKDTQGKYLGCNKAYADLIIGLPSDEITGKTIFSFPETIGQIAAEIYHQKDQELLKKGTVQVYETVIKCSDGVERYFMMNKAAYRDNNNNIAGILGIMIDITLQKNTEDQLKSTNIEINNLLSSIDSILIGVSISDTLTHWNKLAENTFNLTSHEVIGKQILELDIPWQWPLIYEGISTCISENSPVNLKDIKLKIPNEETKYLGISINPIINSLDDIEGFLIYGRDITEKRTLELQLLQDQKLKSIGELAAGIAHEINTPTQYVNDNTHFLENSFEGLNKLLLLYQNICEKYGKSLLSDDAAKEIADLTEEIDLDFIIQETPLAIKQTLEGLDHIAGIVKSMRNLSRPDNNSTSSMDINKTLQDTVTITKNEWKYQAELTLDLEKNLPEIEGFPAELNQVFLNLIVNSSHAIKEAINNGLIDSGKIKITSKKKKEKVQITISDNGIGISQKIIDKIFDPFFTTKEIGKGTGQGLAIAYNIIKKHHGTIIPESQEKKGTTFTIVLPMKLNK